MSRLAWRFPSRVLDMASLKDIRWVRTFGDTALGARLPLYDGKLDLLAIARCFNNLDPARLSVRVMLREEQEDDDDDDDFVRFHSISIDYRTGLSRPTWDEIADEVSLIYGGLPFPDGKTQQNAAVLDGPRLTGSAPSWLSTLWPCRGAMDVESLICHRFIVVCRRGLQVGGIYNVARDARLVDIFADEPYPEEEDSYIDRHVFPTGPEKRLDSILPRIPSSYHWMQHGEIAQQGKVFPVNTINLEVELRSKSTVVLVYGGGDAVLGIDLVSDMTQLGLDRCEVEFYMWATMSSLPYLQLFTDLKTGAVVIYFKDDSVLALETMSMDLLQGFLADLVSKLPLEAACCSAWSAPNRVKMSVPLYP